MVNLTKMAIIVVLLLSMVLAGCGDSAGASDHPSQASDKEASVNSTKTSSQSVAASDTTSNNKVAQKGTTNPESSESSSGTTVIEVRLLAEIHRGNVQLRNELQRALDTIEKQQAAQAMSEAEKSLAKSDLSTTSAELRILRAQLKSIVGIASGDYKHGDESVSDGPVEPQHRQFPVLPNIAPKMGTIRPPLPIAPSQGENRNRKKPAKDGGQYNQYFDDEAGDAERTLDAYGKLPLKEVPPVIEVVTPTEIETVEDVEVPVHTTCPPPAPMNVNITVSPVFRDVGQIKGSANVKGSGNNGDVSMDSPVTVTPDDLIEMEDEEEMPPAPQRVPVRVLPRPISKSTSTTTTAIAPKSSAPTPATTAGQKSVASTKVETNATNPTGVTTSQKGEPLAKPNEKSAGTSKVTSPSSNVNVVTSTPATAPTTKAAPAAKRHRRQQRLEQEEPHMRRSHPRDGSTGSTKTGTSPCDWLKQYPELELEIQKLGVELGKRKSLNKRAEDVERRIELLRARVK